MCLARLLEVLYVFPHSPHSYSCFVAPEVSSRFSVPDCAVRFVISDAVACFILMLSFLPSADDALVSSALLLLLVLTTVVLITSLQLLEPEADTAKVAADITEVLGECNAATPGSFASPDVQITMWVVFSGKVI